MRPRDLLLLLWLMITKSCCDHFNSIDMSILGENPEDVYNKTLASKYTTTMRNYSGGRPASPNTSRYVSPISSSVLSGIRAPVYYGPSPSLNYSTPTLPREYNNYFHDKSTLRGSSSNTVTNNRRPIPLPPISAPLGDKIPMKPPDLVEKDSKKKTINTPSMQKLPDSLNYTEPNSSTSSTTNRINDTYGIVIPAVQNISSSSILRILENGKKYDIIDNSKTRFEQELKPKIHHKEESIKTLSPPTIKTTTTISANKPSYFDGEEKIKPPLIFPHENVIDLSSSGNNPDVIFREQQITEEEKPIARSPIKPEQTESSNTQQGHAEPRARHILGIAWDIHVYLIATLFAVLACCSAFSLLRVGTCKWLLPCGYFILVHAFLTIIGVIRSVFLFYDAYNMNKSFSEPISKLMLNIVFPLLISIFTIVFVFILKTIDVKTGNYYVRKAYGLLFLIMIYLLFSIGVDLYADYTSYASALILISQCIFIFLCVILGITYIYLYKIMSHASIRKQSSVYGTAFVDPLRPSLAHAIRIMLATSLLSLLMAAIQMIGILFIYEPFGKEQPHPWLWWAFQLSVRVIEISMCFLILWAAIQPLRPDEDKESHSHNSASGFALFPSWGIATPRGSDHGGHHGDHDIYPAICNTNQAVHNYSFRSSGKPMYDDIYPLDHINRTNNNRRQLPNNTYNTTERRSIKRYPPDVDDDLVVRSQCQTMNSTAYLERRPQPSPSMLVDENGFVRFRSIADSNNQQDDMFSPNHLIHPNENYDGT